MQILIPKRSRTGPLTIPKQGQPKVFSKQKAQKVHINRQNLDVSFEAWESIHTEVSQKYDDNVVNWLAEEAGLEVIDQFTDENGYFKDYLFEKITK